MLLGGWSKGDSERGLEGGGRGGGFFFFDLCTYIEIDIDITCLYLYLTSISVFREVLESFS